MNCGQEARKMAYQADKMLLQMVMDATSDPQELRKLTMLLGCETVTCGIGRIGVALDMSDDEIDEWRKRIVEDIKSVADARLATVENGDSK